MRQFILFAIGIFLASVSSHAQAASQACADSTLPEGVRSVLASEYGNWRVETLADLDADYQKAWTAKRPNDCPGIVAGHFEGKSELSYALLLIPRAKGKPGFRLVVLSKGSGKSGYSANVLEQNDTDLMSDAAIFRAEPGLQFNEEKFAAFKLKSDGIYFETFEKAGWIYYWKRGKYQRVVESD
jgi:hypothetical protein